jgi:hypothetical protein
MDHETMEHNLNQLIAALREELLHSGQMLVLLERHEALDSVHHAASLVRSAAAVRTQAELMQTARCLTAKCRTHVALALDLHPATNAAALLEALPRHYRVMLQSLQQETDEISARVRQRLSRQDVPMPFEDLKAQL